MNLETSLFVEMAYALGVGLLIGLERSLHQIHIEPLGTPGEAGKGRGSAATAEPGPAEPGPAEPGPASPSPAVASDSTPGAMGLDTVGLRTFTVLSLVGYAAALGSDRFPLMAPVMLAGVCALVVAMYLRGADFGLGITTEAAALGTCGLGMLCHYHPRAAGVLALVLAVVLASKRIAHETVRKMRRVELTDTLKFLIAIFIVLPLLPNRALDPYGAFNPFKVGLLVVLISGIGFVGYFLTRLLGPQRGLGLTGIIGGLTSSTAVTAAMAQEAKASPALRDICVFSTVGANTTMFVRVLVVVAVLDQALALKLAWAIGAMAAVAAVASVVLWIRAGRAAKTPGAAGPEPGAGADPGASTGTCAGAGTGAGTGRVQLKNPFSVGPALKFAAFFVAILFVAKLAKVYLGNQGLYLAAGLSGLADVDAITLSIAEQSKAGTLGHGIGALAITIAVVSNSVVKTGIAITTGGWPFGRLVALCLGAATGAGLLVAALI